MECLRQVSRERYPVGLPRGLRCWHRACSAAARADISLAHKRKWCGVLDIGKRLQVFSIKEGKDKNDIWVKAGMAFVNRDGSMNVYLDVLPLDGKLHVREQAERRDVAGSTTEITSMEAH